MFALDRRSPFDDVFNLQRDVDRLFHQFWSDLPTRMSANAPGSFQVNTTEDGWRIDIPLPGIDPQNVALELAGTTLSVRVEEPESNEEGAKLTRYEQTLTIPHFLDAERLTASHRHGMLRLTLPVKESVKPRRIEIEGAVDEKKQLTAA